jgi:hypothetical protein
MSWSPQLCWGFGQVGLLLFHVSHTAPRLVSKDCCRGFDRAQNPIRQSTA